jgi:hypothetical protein
MSVQANETIARRYLEGFWNRGDIALLAEIVAADAVGHVAGLLREIGLLPEL